MTPGIKTSEFKAMILGIITGTILPTLVLWGWVTPENSDAFAVALSEFAKAFTTLIAALVPIVMSIKAYIESRTRVKEAASASGKK